MRLMWLLKKMNQTVSRTSNNNTAFLGLGSNLGDKLAFIKKAIKDILLNENIKLIKISSIYKTPPIGYEEQDVFLNAVLKISTKFTPFELLKFLQTIERELGRKRFIKWGPRTIDIDILFYNNWIIDKNNLQIPHPLMHERAFVLIPFNEIDGDFIHPVLNKSVTSLLNSLNLNDIKDIEMVVDAKNLASL